MIVSRNESSVEAAKAASKRGVELLADAIQSRGIANVIVATGASQFDLYAQLVQSQEVDWTAVNVFHLDEYIGVSDHHPASFRKYLKERFLDQVGPVKSFVPVVGDAFDLDKELARLNHLIAEHPIDVAFIGIGENGHLAFNDPPADFETTRPYIEVTLDDACRRQQYGEGWFETFEAVPQRAVSMSIAQILKSKHLIVTVPDGRKAAAVQQALEGPLTNLCPASILRKHESCYLYLDADSASLLS